MSMAGKRRFDRGRWQTHRERLHIEDPVPRAGVADAHAVSDVIGGVLKGLGLNAQQWLMVLGDEWTALVGAQVAKHSRPGGFHAGTLTVFVDSAPWMDQLNRVAKPQMLAKLQERFGPNRIKAVRFTADPEGPGGAQG